MKVKYNLEYDRGFVLIKIEPNSQITGFLPNVEGWLECDVGSQGEKNLMAIKEYLKHPTEEYLLLGSNAYEVHVKKDYTTVSYDYEYANPEMVPCTIPTQMVCELLQAWTKEYAKYSKEGAKAENSNVATKTLGEKIKEIFKK